MLSPVTDAPWLLPKPPSAVATNSYMYGGSESTPQHFVGVATGSEGVSVHCVPHPNSGLHLPTSVDTRCMANVEPKTPMRNRSRPGRNIGTHPWRFDYITLHEGVNQIQFNKGMYDRDWAARRLACPTRLPTWRVEFSTVANAQNDPRLGVSLETSIVVHSFPTRDVPITRSRVDTASRTNEMNAECHFLLFLSYLRDYRTQWLIPTPSREKKKQAEPEICLAERSNDAASPLEHPPPGTTKTRPPRYYRQWHGRPQRT